MDVGLGLAKPFVCCHMWVIFAPLQGHVLTNVTVSSERGASRKSNLVHERLAGVMVLKRQHGVSDLCSRQLCVTKL